jgi:hypothetical protein
MPRSAGSSFLDEEVRQSESGVTTTVLGLAGSKWAARCLSYTVSWVVHTGHRRAGTLTAKEASRLSFKGAFHFPNSFARGLKSIICHFGFSCSRTMLTPPADSFDRGYTSICLGTYVLHFPSHSRILIQFHTLNVTTHHRGVF